MKRIDVNQRAVMRNASIGIKSHLGLRYIKATAGQFAMHVG
jgi:hypothetical protein